MNKIIMLTLLISTIVNAGTLAIVGDGAQCGFSTIQSAIDSGAEEIRVMVKTYTEKLTINDISVNIRGGFNSCADAVANQQGEVDLGNLIIHDVIIDHTGLNQGSIIAITGNSQRNTVNIEYFKLTGATSTPIEFISADVEMTVHNVQIHGNSITNGGVGGGIGLFLGKVDLNIVDSLIFNNEAASGGGIYCAGEGNTIITTGLSGVSENRAIGLGSTGKGGGIYLTNGCSLGFYSGTNDSIATLGGISSNHANAEGGGIYADLEANINLVGQDFGGQIQSDSSEPVNVSFNVSDFDNSGNERGGGIYITGENTFLLIAGVLIQENTSPNGGGVYINDKAGFISTRLSASCWDNIKCNLFIGNIARNNRTGGAIQNDQGVFDISHTYFEDNQAGSGTVIYSYGSQSINQISNSVFNNNGDDSNNLADNFVIRAASNAVVEVGYSTFADNAIQDSVFGITDNSTLNIIMSIIDESSVLAINNNPGTIEADCIIAHDLTNLSGTNIELLAPEFVDRANRDYHLNPLTSPAIDFCPAGINQILDIDLQPRGFDDPTRANRGDDPLAVFDLGADESYGNEIIFDDGFE